MKIKASSIGNIKDFVVSDEISTADVESFFDGLEDCRALSPVKYEAHLLRHEKYIALTAAVEASLELCCHRCGTSFVKEFKQDIELKIVDAASIEGSEEVVLSEEDLDTVTYQNGEIDLDSILLESIYLEIDGECLCREDCKGVCTVCGQNLNLGPCKCRNL